MFLLDTIYKFNLCKPLHLKNLKQDLIQPLREKKYFNYIQFFF